MPTRVVADGCITCYSKRSAPWSNAAITELYVDAQGNVMPCCFIAVSMAGTASESHIQIQSIQNTLGESNNLNHHSLKEMLDNDVLSVWSKSWEEKSINVCWQYCGKSTEKDRVIDNLWAEDE
jgi:hypothetical protein